MSIKFLGLILGSVALSALAQLFLKLGMSSAVVQQALGQGHPLQAVWAVASNFQVIAGLSLYALGAMLWLLVLARVDLRLAYPCVGGGVVDCASEPRFIGEKRQMAPPGATNLFSPKHMNHIKEYWRNSPEIMALIVGVAAHALVLFAILPAMSTLLSTS